MKKKNLKSLKLKKNTISSFNTTKIDGGGLGDALRTAAIAVARATACHTCNNNTTCGMPCNTLEDSETCSQILY